jgi:hypothetical protein
LLEEVNRTLAERFPVEEETPAPKNEATAA